MPLNDRKWVRTVMPALVPLRGAAFPAPMGLRKDEK